MKIEEINSNMFVKRRTEADLIMGISGYSGYSGYSGLGSSGYSGYSGSNGAAAASGYSGYSGSGVSGYSGAGVSGYSGYSGIDAQGVSGYSGYSGVEGTSGYSGIGTSGYSGFSGIGTSGYSGYSGIGTSGFSGYSGKSGYSGYSGATGLNGLKVGWIQDRVSVSGAGGWSIPGYYSINIADFFEVNSTYLITSIIWQLFTINGSISSFSFELLNNSKIIYSSGAISDFVWHAIGESTLYGSSLEVGTTWLCEADTALTIRIYGAGSSAGSQIAGVRTRLMCYKVTNPLAGEFYWGTAANIAMRLP